MVNTIKRLILFVITFFYSLSYASQIYSVKAVIDGDTILLYNRSSVRYIGIDSPEINHQTGIAAPFGFEAKRINEQIISGKPIKLEYDTQKKDRYGRWLAYVFTSDGMFINEEIVKRGCAWVLFKAPNTKYSTQLLNAQRYAMSKRLGMWATWGEQNTDYYIGNIKSKRFHRSDCPFGKEIALNNRIKFAKKWNAFYAGFSPCKKCILMNHSYSF